MLGAVKGAPFTSEQQIRSSSVIRLLLSERGRFGAGRGGQLWRQRLPWVPETVWMHGWNLFASSPCRAWLQSRSKVISVWVHLKSRTTAGASLHAFLHNLEENWGACPCSWSGHDIVDGGGGRMDWWWPQIVKDYGGLLAYILGPPSTTNWFFFPFTHDSSFHPSVITGALPGKTNWKLLSVCNCQMEWRIQSSEIIHLTLVVSWGGNIKQGYFMHLALLKYSSELWDWNCVTSVLKSKLCQFKFGCCFMLIKT